MFVSSTGIHVEYDVSKLPGSRVKSLNVLCTKCRVPSYEPVQDEAVYKVVLPSYLVKGGDGFSMIRDEKLSYNSGETGFRETLIRLMSYFLTLLFSLPGDLDISVVANYISKRKKVYPSLEGRIKVFSSSSGLQANTAPLVLLVSLVLFWSLRGSS